MPQNCKSVETVNVIYFFVVEVDGVGRRDGLSRNESVPCSIVQFKIWKFCELTEDEFERLILPDKTPILIRDKDMATLKGPSKHIVESYVELLKAGRNLAPLIVRERLPVDLEGASFHIMDGAKRTLAHKKYFKDNPYTPVKAYVGTKEA